MLECSSYPGHFQLQDRNDDFRNCGPKDISDSFNPHLLSPSWKLFGEILQQQSNYKRER
jgi:hypothetical protein